MKVATAREGLRAACDDWFKDRGFAFVNSRDAYVRKCTSSEHFGEEGMFVKRRFMVFA